MALEGYLEWVRAYDGITDVFGDCDFFQEHAADIGLTSAETILSVGAGYGRLESFLQGAGLLPSLREYHAVEPLDDVHQQLQTVLPDILPGVKLVLSKTYGDLYEAPTNTFDIIVMSKMLSYIKDKVGLIRKAIGWLKDGGTLIIEFIEECHALTYFAKNLGTTERKYVASNLREDLKTVGLPYEEFPANYEVNLGAVTKPAANMLCMRQLSDQELEDFRSYISKTLPTGIDHQPNTVYVIRKGRI